MAGKRPASTEVTTRCLGGKGGTWGAKNKRPRNRCKARRGNCQGLTPSVWNVPTEGGKAQASTCNKVVLPAPEGPMMATCSPLAMRKFKAWMAGAAPGRAAGCRALSPSSKSSTGCSDQSKPALRAADSKPL